MCPMSSTAHSDDDDDDDDEDDEDDEDDDDSASRDAAAALVGPESSSDCTCAFRSAFVPPFGSRIPCLGVGRRRFIKRVGLAPGFVGTENSSMTSSRMIWRRPS